MMAASVKRKIRLGTLFLFLLLLLLGGVGIYHLSKLKKDAKLILQDNYESLDYAHTMMRALNNDTTNKISAVDNFEAALELQESNITEPGEDEATASLRDEFSKWKAGNSSYAVLHNINQQLDSILSVNMRAIERKNKVAEETADKAMTYMTLIAAVVFLVGLTFSFNFPSVITKPIHEIIEGIRQVASKNYKHRIHLNNKDEFGQMANSFNEMAERLEYFENSNLNKILFEKSRAEAVINSLKDASIGIDKNDTVLFANDQALLLLGLQAKDIVGVQVNDVARRNDLFQYLLDEKANMPFKIVVDNRENYFVKELMDVSQDGTSSKVIVLKNITSFKELDAAKTNFIATVSHELKTPLASSDFSLKLLDDERIGKLSQEQKELVEHLRQDNQRMLRILGELLNMAQLEAGKIQLNVSSVDPANIADSGIEAVQNTAREKKIYINKDYNSGTVNVKADAEKTAWVLNNFLTNAIKHSSQDSTILVAIKQADAFVRFSVSDHGPGIPPEYLSRIFDRFFQVPGSGTKGTGLGLSICKEFIEAENGKIWVTSEIGIGSTFGFDLPAA